jgi:hypothetical protein
MQQKGGQVLIDKLNYHLFFPEINLSYLSIPKNASVFVHLNIVKQIKNKERYYKNLENLHFYVRKDFAIKSQSVIKNTETLVIFRDPAERIVSAFCDKYIRKSSLLSAPAFFNKSEHKNIGHITFENFCEKIFNSKPELLDEHWAPQHNFLFESQKYNFVDFNKINNNKYLQNVLKYEKEDKEFIGANQTNYLHRYQDYAGDVSLKYLKNIYSKYGTVPENGCFLSEKNKKEIYEYYKKDIEIYRGITK